MWKFLYLYFGSHGTDVFQILNVWTIFVNLTLGSVVKWFWKSKRFSYTFETIVSKKSKLKHSFFISSFVLTTDKSCKSHIWLSLHFHSGVAPPNIMKSIFIATGISAKIITPNHTPFWYKPHSPISFMIWSYSVIIVPTWWCVITAENYVVVNNLLYCCIVGKTFYRLCLR